MSLLLRRHRAGVIALLILAFVAQPRTSEGQRKKPANEFTRQGLLIINFSTVGATDVKLGKRAADAVRGRVNKLVDRRRVDVISSHLIAEELLQGGFSTDSALHPSLLVSLGRRMRADEYVQASAARTPNGVQLAGHLVLLRDKRLRQPLPVATAPTLDVAADQFARAVVDARAQLEDQRRCENALRELRGSAAIEFARAGIGRYRSATIARVCLVWSLRATQAPASDVLSAARELLALDAENAHGLESAAIALDSLRQPAAAATMWLRLADTDTSDRELTERVLRALFDGGNARAAEPLALRAWASAPEHLPFVRHAWRITVRTGSWSNAIRAGESLLLTDSAARADPSFTLRLAAAYHANGQPFKAMEVAARGVTLFPDDGRLYALYSQFVKAESDTTIPRGLARFPDNAALLALNAKELRSRGRLAESVAASRLAIAADSTLPQGDMLVAQGEFELGRPDSALVSLRRALARGEDTTTVAQFALGKGNTLYRAASGTRAAADFQLATRFLAFADSLRSAPTSRFLLGAAALGIVQSALTEAPRLDDRTQACAFARAASEMMPVARAGLDAGRDVAPEAAQQSLEYLTTLEPYSRQQLGAYCDAVADDQGGAARSEAPGDRSASPLSNRPPPT